MRSPLALASLLVAPILGWLPGCAGDDAPDEAHARRAIVDGVTSVEYPGTGILFTSSGGGCTATLIGCDTVLTAAHCACAGFGADCAATTPSAPAVVMFPGAGVFAVTAQHIHPDYNDIYEHDIAVLRLDRPATGVRPVPLASAPLPPGSTATIVGYGDALEAGAFGVKRVGAVATQTCEAERGEGKVCWRFDGGATSSASNVCYGDSGGPTYFERGGVVEIVGVHSTENGANCRKVADSVQSADIDVFAHRAFVAGVGGVLGGACGDLPAIGEAGARVVETDGSLASGEATTFEIEVPPGTAELRVALNGASDVVTDLDVYLRHGAPAGAAAFDVGNDDASLHAFVPVLSPRPGTWFGTVDTTEGAEFQVTAVVLAGAPLTADDRYDVARGEVLTIDATGGLLANDVGESRGPLVAEVAEPPASGALELSPDGSLRFTPADGFVGVDTFTYTASDGTYASTATVSIAVSDGASPGGGPEGADPGTDGDRSSDVVGGCAAGGSGGFGALGLALAAWAARRRRR